jgi:hypothetical protein
MKNYIATTRDGRVRMISALTQSDAFQQASTWAGGDGLLSFELQ